MIIANENTKYQLKQITTEIIYILNTELKQRTHYENDRISISHIPIINIFRGQRIGINTRYSSEDEEGALSNFSSLFTVSLHCSMSTFVLNSPTGVA